MNPVEVRSPHHVSSSIDFYLFYFLIFFFNEHPVQLD